MLEQNWQVVQVFCQCQGVWQIGMAGARYQGIAAQELQAACWLHAVPPYDLPDLIEGIRVMDAETREIHNRANK